MVEEQNHVEEGFKKLLSQWDNSSSVRGLLESILQPINEAEQGSQDVYDSFSIITAIGKQLDMLGALLGVPRNGRSDEDYRIIIMSKISTSRGSGTTNELISLLSALTGQTANVWEHYPIGVIGYAKALPNVAVIDGFYEAAIAGSDRGHVLFDADGETLAFTDGQTFVNELADEAFNNVVDEVGNQIVVDTIIDGYDPNGFSSFPDESEINSKRGLPHVGSLDYIIPVQTGYGLGYGLDYGGTN